MGAAEAAPIPRKKTDFAKKEEKIGRFLIKNTKTRENILLNFVIFAGKKTLDFFRAE